MSRQHLTEIIVGFFAAFSKVHPAAAAVAGAAAADEPDSSSSGGASSPGLRELETVLSRQLAYTAYIGFYHLLGGTHLEATVPNMRLVRELAAQHQASLLFPAVRPHCFR